MTTIENIALNLAETLQGQPAGKAEEVVYRHLLEAYDLDPSEASDIAQRAVNGGIL